MTMNGNFPTDEALKISVDSLTHRVVCGDKNKNIIKIHYNDFIIIKIIYYLKEYKMNHRSFVINTSSCTVLESA